MASKEKNVRFSGRPRDCKYPPDYVKSSRPIRRFSNSKKTPIDKVEDKLFRSEDYVEQSLEFANTAICHLNERGVEYELVKSGLFSGARITNGAIFHFNFKAKRKDDPKALVETFIVQFRLMGDCPSDLTLFIDVCASLGPTSNLLWEVHDGGCLHCTTLIYHPRGGRKRLLRGLVNDNVSWLERNTIPGHLRPDWYKYSERLGHSGDSSGSSSNRDSHI
ncbi:hypothetical protein vseg_003240 [Gypsophila vaccaria]